MTAMAHVRSRDVTASARAYAAMGLVKAVARIVYLLGVPLSAFVVVFDVGRVLPLGDKLALTAGLGAGLFIIVLLGLSYAILTLRPLLGAVFVALGAAPAIHAMAVYLLSGGDWREPAFFALLTAVIAAPLVWAWILVWRLSPEERALARPAPPIRSPASLLREMFGVWPGLRRSWIAGFGSTILSWVATLFIWMGGFVLTPLAVLSVTLTPLLLYKEGWTGPALAFGVILGAAWLVSVLQSLLRGGARWMSRASLDDQVKRDSRPPVLFLRSFQDDQVSLPLPNPVSGAIRAVFTLGLGRRRLDHILIERFSRYGPALALGNPGEKGLPFGAARVYCDHADWQDKVAEIAEESAHVVLVADRTPGVEWEIRTFIEGPWREKTLFVCAPKSGDIRENDVLAEYLNAAGTPLKGAPILAVWWAPDGTLEVLRSTLPRSPETFVVALNAFMTRRAAAAS